MKKLILCFLVIYSCIVAYSQGRGEYKVHHFDVGAGLGYEYGGIGFQASYAPIPYASIFAGIGTNGGFGWNVGTAWHILPKTTRYMFRPFIEAMYGYNLVFVTVGDYYSVEQFYGPSVGAGCELRFGKSKRHGIDLVLLRYAFWTQDAWDTYNNASADEKPALGPWGFSLGYHFEF